jgi:hypothetical protein
MALRSLIVSLEARTAAFESALARTDKSIAGFERSIQRAQHVLAFAATAGGIAVAAKKLFDLGAAVEDARDRFRTTFGESAAVVERFGQRFGAMAGLSQRATQELLAGIGATTQGMGFAEAQSAALAQQVAQLAGDLAEFRGVETATVVQQLTAALAGQTRGLKEYGILISEADVQQRAFAQTGKVIADTLTDQERATATLTLITERMGKATGELAASQDEAGIKAAQLRAQFQDIADDFAMKMLPALERMLPVLTALAGVTARWVEQLGLASLQVAEWMDPGMIARQAERRSLAGLGGAAVPRARAKLAQEQVGLGIHFLNLEEEANAAALEFRSGGSPEYLKLENAARSQMAGIGERITFLNELIAMLDAKTAAVAGAAATGTTVGTGAAWTGRPAGLGMTNVGAQAAGAFGVRSAPLGRRFQGDEGLASPFAFTGDWKAPEKAARGFEDASTITIEAFGRMSEAVIRGSLTIEDAMIGAITQILQAVAQLHGGKGAAQLSETVGAIGGIVSGFSGSAMAAPVEVTLNVGAIDTQSAAQVLRQNRGVIIGTIQDALARPARGASFQRHLR